MRKSRLMALVALALASCVPAHEPPQSAASGAVEAQARQVLIDYLRARNTTGFLAIQRGKVLVEANFPAPAGDAVFSAFAYERTADGALLEDVASQQKSFVAILIAIAIDKRLIDPGKPVSAYLGPGWAKASPEQEAAIRVADILTMSSGLDEGFAYQAPSGTRFFYNTPVYAVTKRILERASGRSLEAITQEWLTAPLGMAETAWRQRPAALGNVGNATGLVTSPRDIARMGEMILREGLAPDGTRVVSRVQLAALFAPSATNPAYGRLWWLNSGGHVIGATGQRREGRLIPDAPADLVAALGFLDRRLYVVPSLGLVVVRTGAATATPDFDAQLWRLLAPLLDR